MQVKCTCIFNWHNSCTCPCKTIQQWCTHDWGNKWIVSCVWTVCKDHQQFPSATRHMAFRHSACLQTCDPQQYRLKGKNSCWRSWLAIAGFGHIFLFLCVMNISGGRLTVEVTIHWTLQKVASFVSELPELLLWSLQPSARLSKWDLSPMERSSFFHDTLQAPKKALYS